MNRIKQVLGAIKNAARPILYRYRSWPWYKKCLGWLGLLIALHFFYLILLILFFPPLTTTQLGSLIHGRGMQRDYVCLNEISGQAVLAVIGAEDQLFMEHYGFDLESIEKALEHNKKKPKRMRGASTISQQVAKNIFLWQGRSWFRKGLEVYFTLVIETLWSKKRIMELYLNCAEMGNGIFGIEAASRAYFRKSAKYLSREEAAKIASSLPNPRRYKVNPLSPYVSFRFPWVMQQMDQLEADENIQLLLKQSYYR